MSDKRMPWDVRVPAAMVAAALALAAAGGQGVLRAQQVDVPAMPVLSTERAEAFAQAAADSLAYMPGDVLVKFKDGVDVFAQQRALDAAVRSRPAVSELRQIGDVFRLHDDGEPNAEILAAQLSAQPEVAYAEPNYIFKHHVTPTDPSFGRQWNFTSIDLPTAWDINPGGAGAIVAVVDTGVTTFAGTVSARTWNGTAIQAITVAFGINPDFTASRFVSPRDFITGGGDVVLDLEGHGTHVASTIGEDTNNAIGEAGIAYRARIMPVKVCVGYWEVQFSLSQSGRTGYAPLNSGGCDTASIAAGIRYAADNGADVINLSLGGAGQSTTLRDAITYAVGRGAFVSIAMGNEFEDGNPTEYPAADARTIDGAMAVGAVGRSLGRAYYSNTGDHVEIAAPGGDVRDGGAAGMIWQATLFPPDSDPSTVVFPRFDRYAEVAYQGTSMAAPHVAGVAALMASQGINSPAAIEAVIKRTARKLGTSDAARPGWNTQFGYGLIQPRAALRGFGIAR